MATIKKMMAKLLKDTNSSWLEYADDYQSDCAFLYFWFNNLDNESTEGREFFQAGLDASPDWQWALQNESETGVQEFWLDKKWEWIKFWDASNIMKHSVDSSENVKLVHRILEVPIGLKFIDFAKPWIDIKDPDALNEFNKKYYTVFREEWIKAIRVEAPSDEDIFGNIWNLDASPDPVDDIKEDPDQDEEIIPAEYRVNFGGSIAWVNEVDGEIKLSKNSPGEDWMFIESVNTGDKGVDGEILFVPNVLEGVRDWWVGLGNSDSDINHISKTKIIISGAGEYSKSWLRRCFFVKDKDGDLVISY
jgi:hypothetical protein